MSSQMWRRVSLRAVRYGTIALLLVLGLLGTGALAQEDGPRVDILEIGGPLDRTMVEYLDRALISAARDGVEVVVVQLDSPGALGVGPEAFTQLVEASEVPVAVWIGPPGARATGAAVHLALAADILALAPGSLFGGANPPDLAAPSGQEARSTAEELGRLAALRGRNQEQASAYASGAATVAGERQQTALAPDARVPTVVDPERVTVGDDQTLVDRGLADLVATDLTEVLQTLDGRELTRADGSTVTLNVDPVSASVRFNNQGLWGRVLHATAGSPTLAYLLVVGGLVALLFEWFQPGFGVAGISGVLTAALGAYGLAVLPTRWWALAILVFGLVLLAVDLALARLGTATVLGTLATAAGSWWLFAGSPEVAVSTWVIALVVVFCAVFFVFVMTTVLRAQGVVAQTSADRVVGQLGVVRSVLNPEGHVFVAGVLWRARVPEETGKVSTGTTVRVVGLHDGRTLDVQPAESSAASSATAST